MSKFAAFGKKLADYVLSKHSSYSKLDDTKVSVHNGDDGFASLDLTPIELTVQPTTAKFFFHEVKSYKDLVFAYMRMTEDFKFENDVPRLQSLISNNALLFGKNIMGMGYTKFDDVTAKLVAEFVSDLDIYCAVKALESLLHSKADLGLLKISKLENFDVHFDHLAIRCGSSATGDARQVADLLINEHGYTAPQLPDEAHYVFPDGWSAFPLYKMLDNGQVLRLFIDQSDDDKQIIQFWNWVYGFTAHHIALRATRVVNGVRADIPLEELTALLNKHGYDTMAPTGMYTEGLLKQLFTKPEHEENLSTMVMNHVYNKWPSVGDKIKNGKLLEVVSRTELPAELAEEFFALYGIWYDVNNKHHSAPIYQYFLPAQAQHVIDTSIVV